MRAGRGRLAAPPPGCEVLSGVVADEGDSLSLLDVDLLGEALGPCARISGAVDAGMIQASVAVEVGIVEALTVERARVAAIVAGALMANAVPLLMEAPVGPVFEHGRTAPIWVSSNRARALQSWQPPRAAETPQQANSD